MAKISKLALVSGVAELVASAGAGVVIGNLVKATTPEDIGKVQKVLVTVGGYTLGGVLSDLSARYVASQIRGYSERVSAIFHPEEVEEDENPEESTED